MTKVIKIFGGPGTGKTTTLIGYLKTELTINNLNPLDIAFVTFSKAAANEMKERISYQLDIKNEDLMFFGTIHSLCYKLLGLTKENHISEKIKQNFASSLGYQYTQGETDTDDSGFSFSLGTEQTLGGALYNIDSFLKNNLLDANNWEKASISENHKLDLTFEQVKEFREKWKEEKEKNGLRDYSDMIEKVIENKITLPVRILFVDEFQDLSPLLIQVYEFWKQKVERTYIAGDIHQAIYGFQGANPKFFLNEKGEEIVLNKTHRLKSEILSLSQHLIKPLKLKKEIDLIPHENGGKITRIINKIRYEDLLKLATGNTFILARTNWVLQKIRYDLLEEGIPFNILRFRHYYQFWNQDMTKIHNAFVKIKNKTTPNFDDGKTLIERLPVKSILKKGIKAKIQREEISWSNYEEFKELFEENVDFTKMLNYCKISDDQREALRKRLENFNQMIGKIDLAIGTIHASKGKEAETVIVFLEIPLKVFQNMETTEGLDDERRVFYVALTRTKENLIIVENFYNMDKFHLI